MLTIRSLVIFIMPSSVNLKTMYEPCMNQLLRNIFPNKGRRLLIYQRSTSSEHYCVVLPLLQLQNRNYLILDPAILFSLFRLHSSSGFILFYNIYMNYFDFLRNYNCQKIICIQKSCCFFGGQGTP